MNVAEACQQAEPSTLSPGIAHIVASDNPKRGICGARIKGTVPRPGAGKCAVCLDLAMLNRRIGYGTKG
jgi:hypothetical protein